MSKLYGVYSGLLALLLSTVVHAESMKGDNVHARTWNKFADDTLALHRQIAKKKKLTVRKTKGGYHGNNNFYLEEAYYEEGTDLLVSRIQWEVENPQNLHTIEVFVYDDKGRVVRDYAAAYLPTYRNAPTQTLISFHAYNGQLHAFRTFDASGSRIVERCTGTLNGKMVDFILDEDEIYNALDGYSNLMEQPEYKNCFKGLPDEAGKYLVPQ